jgi:hypothetical protein
MPKLDRDRVLSLIRKDRRFRGDVHKVAELVDIPYGTLRNAIGSGDQMRYSRVSLLAEALLVPPEWILADDDAPTPPSDGLAAAS